MHDPPGALIDLLTDRADIMASFFEIELVAGNGVAALPFDQFVLVAIKRGVMLAVAAIAVSFALDQRRAAALAYALDHAFTELDHGEQIVA